MPGKILAKAAEIIISAGGQIDALVEKLEEEMASMLQEQGYVVRVSSGLIQDKNEWLTTQWMHCFSLREGKKKKKDSAHVNVHLVLHDEQFVNVKGWEPAIFVMYSPVHEEFGIDGLKSIVGENDICIRDQRFWRWAEESSDQPDSWMFALPLVSINNEKDIEKLIIDPVRRLLSDPSKSGSVFPCGSRIFKFSWEGDTFSMS